MVPWLALTHFWGGGVKTASPQLHTRSLKNTQPLLSRGTAQRSHSALADIITASPWRGAGSGFFQGSGMSRVFLLTSNMTRGSMSELGISGHPQLLKREQGMHMGRG